jgi:hypothetical protein
MTLAAYKSAIVSLQSAIKQAKSPETKREWTRALVHAQRRVRQIENRVLVAQTTD